jgi:exopolysaccharide biosynthesis polyprenyl glycosylphosphotransferase
MTTGPADTAVRSVRLPTSSRAGRPGVAERDVRQVILVCRLLGDIGALLLGLMVAQGIQQALMAMGSSVEPLGSIGVFNTVAILLWLALFANFGLYDSRRLVNAVEEFKLILQAVATGTVAATFIAFVVKVPTQRSWVLATWAGCTIAVLATRFAYRLIVRSMRRSGVLVSRLLIVGAGREGRDLCRAVTRARHLGFEVVGFLDDNRPIGPAVAGLPEIVGASTDVREAVREHEAQAVLVAGGSVATETAERVYRDLQELPVDLHLSTGVLGVAANRMAVQRFDDIPVLGLRPAELTPWQRTLKRTFDLIVASLLLLVLSPILLACALAVRLTSPGPVLFRQARVGRDGTVFSMHKFRSMVADAEARLAALQDQKDTDGPIFKLHRDPRVTPVGRLLRAFSIDELPQLLNVIRGDMSLVGPRPLPTYEVDLTDPWARNRLRVPPGLKSFAPSGDMIGAGLAGWRYETNRLPPQRPWSARPPGVRRRPHAGRGAVCRRPLPSRGCPHPRGGPAKHQPLACPMAPRWAAGAAQRRPDRVRPAP